MKVCIYYPSRRCSIKSCSIFNCASGNVECCVVHPNPMGFFMRPKVVRVLGSIWNKHLKGRS